MALPFYRDFFLEVAVARAFSLDSYQAMLATMVAAPFSEKYYIRPHFAHDDNNRLAQK
jgi:hypothetical protein